MIVVRVIGLALLLVLLLASPLYAAPALNIADYGGQPDGTDTAPALNAAIAQAQGGGVKTIAFGGGVYHFASSVSVLRGGVSLVGQGKATTVLQCDMANCNFLVVYDSGTTIRDLALWMAPGLAGSVALHMIASDAIGPGGNHEIANVWITGGGTWVLPLFLDGGAKLYAPAGIRTVRLDNVSVFNATWWAVEWWNCVGCEWFGGGVYQGAGTTQAIWLGGTYATRNRIDADIDWAASYVQPGAMR